MTPEPQRLQRFEQECAKWIDKCLEGAPYIYFTDPYALDQYLKDMGFKQHLWYSYYKHKKHEWYAEVEPVLCYGATRRLKMSSCRKGTKDI